MTRTRFTVTLALIVSCAFFCSGCMQLLETAASAAAAYGLYKATKK